MHEDLFDVVFLGGGLQAVSDLMETIHILPAKCSHG
jgi:hypothetical protein